MIADPSSDFAPHSRWGALEQCSLTLIGASLNSPESSALYQNSVLRNSAAVDKNSVVDRNSVKLVDKSSVVVENT